MRHKILARIVSGGDDYKTAARTVNARLNKTNYCPVSCSLLHSLTPAFKPVQNVQLSLAVSTAYFCVRSNEAVENSFNSAAIPHRP
jgi:hypothetical protein